MDSDPCLGKQPQEPDPGVLMGDEIVEKMSRGTLEEEIGRYGIVEEARIAVS